MNRKAVSGIMLTVMLFSILTLAFSIKLPGASGDIYIRGDGSISPADGRIITADLFHYNFTEDISGPIVIERDNIVLDGAGYAIQGLGQTSGVLLQNRVNVTIMDVKIDGFESGIQFSGSSNCYIYNNTVTASYGLRFSNSNGTRISDNNLIANDNTGIYLWHSSGNILSENTITNNGDHGIYLWHSSNTNILFGNTITNNGCYGIFLSDSSNNNTLSGNTITNNSHGIRLGDSSNYNTLSGNSIMHNGYYGIFLSDSSSNNLSGNTITNNSHGIFLSDSSNNNTLSGNTITSNSFYGIYFSDSSSNTLSGNSITNNGDHGIFLWYSSSNTLSGNSVTNNDDFGIYLFDSLANALSGNTIAYNGVGIFEATSSNSLVYHNNFLNNEIQTVQNCLNSWDNGLLEVGNYWSDYKGTDQNGDGFGDTSTPHHKDRYPFIVPVGPIPFFLEGVRYDCIFLGNATLSMLDFDHDSKSIGFDICLASKNAYFNVTTPRKLLNGQFNVTIDGVAVASVLTWNKTHTSTYFELSIPPFSEYSICHVRIISRIATPLTGDVNIDGFVDIFDAVILAKAFGSKPRDSNWNATADVNIDGFVDIFDAVLIAKNFGKLPSACAR